MKDVSIRWVGSALMCLDSQNTIRRLAANMGTIQPYSSYVYGCVQHQLFIIRNDKLVRLHPVVIYDNRIHLYVYDKQIL